MAFFAVDTVSRKTESGLFHLPLSHFYCLTNESDFLSVLSNTDLFFDYFVESVFLPFVCFFVTGALAFEATFFLVADVFLTIRYLLNTLK